MRVINFAHAQFYVIGAFALYDLYGVHHLSYWLAVVAAAAIAGAVGLGVEVVVVRPVRGDPLRAMIATLGVLLLLNGIVTAIFGAESQYLQAPINGVWTIAGAVVPEENLIAVFITAGLIVGLFALLTWTRLGKALRAVAQDRVGAQLQGINIERLNRIGFVLGTALAGLAGALILPLTSAVNPGVGDDILAKMFIIVIIGGLGSIGGAVLGAFALAAIETFAFQYVGGYATLMIYLIVIGMLLVKPEGIVNRA
jgi:branched-chain amino acid transport system permease protein